MRIHVLCLVSATVLLATSVIASAAESASMFRGNPALTGVYATAPVNAIAGVKFSVHTQGPLRGSPAVSDGVAYFGSGDGNLYAVGAADGRERWRFATGAAVTSTPALHAGRVYFSSRDGTLYALRAGNGKVDWKFNFGTDLAAQNYWDFYLSSPVIVDGTLYVGGGDGNLYALDAGSGKPVWKFDAGSRIRSTPAISGNAIVFGTMSGHVIAVDRKDGKRQWDFATKGASNKFSDVGNDTTSVYGSASIADGVVAIGGRDGFAYGIDLASGKEKWRVTHDGSSWILSNAIADGTLYIGSGSASIVQAVDLQTGKEKWRFKTSSAVFSSPSINAGTLLVSDFNGNLYALDRASGKQRWKFPMGYRSLSSPIVVDGTVYCASDEGIFFALNGIEGVAAAATTPARRIVYHEGRKNEKSFSWFANDVDVAILGYFKSQGYESMDAAQLAQFMQEQLTTRARSVIVFADNRMPASIVEVDSDQALVRRYLNAGGKIALLGPNPLAYRPDPKTGEVETIDFALPSVVFGIKFLDPDIAGGYYGAATTKDGERWGLRGFYVGVGALDPAQATTVLARDEFGKASSWVKNYGGPEGTGLLQLNVQRAVPTAMFQFQAAIEYGLD